MTDVSILGHHVAYPTGVTILDLFCQQVGNYPEKVAVRYAHDELSYQDLNGKVNALVAHLQESGIRKGHTVPVIIGNSLELPIAWLALVKLGAVFVPFDPDWPVKRIEAALEQVKSGTILVSSKFDTTLGPGIDVINVESKELDVSDRRLAVETIVPHDLIYGFFTSGSTGQPKCALNRHLGIFNRFHYMTSHFSQCQPKTVLLNSRHVFDPSVWQILWTLTVGGEVVIPEQVGHLDLACTIDIIHRRSITMTDFVPSIFNALSQLIGSNPLLVEKLSSLQCLLIGGEAINVKAVNKFRQLLPHVRLTNTYGPTEASIGMVFHDICEEDSTEIPLGSPIDNTFLAILDEQFRPVPRGQIGEIFIGGDCLGSGYLGDYEKTCAVFIPNPISVVPGDKLYRTGDLGRQDERERVHFCGRLDNQTKVNGVRIEVGEVEHALVCHKDVNEAVVVPVEHGALDRKKLCAFIVCQNSLSGDVLKNHLATLLPEYMLPSEFIFCATLPLTPNGKVDRQGLIESIKRTGQGSAENLESMSQIERELLNRFRRALGNDRVELDDNFFELGGDSLSALEVTLGNEGDDKVDLEVPDIYVWPTARDLAKSVIQRVREESKIDVDWERESRLADTIQFPPPSIPTPPETIFVTGTTGFVGAHVLSALLQSNSSRIIALVRDGHGRAFERCRCALARYGLWKESFVERLSVLPGDLSKPNFGLEPGVWKELELRTTSIVHCGAMVDLLRSYRQHRPHNVVGTLEVIRLAASGIPKHLHYVSTLSVFDAPHTEQDRDLIKESDVPDLVNFPSGGYQQSKLVAENLVRKVASDGLAVTIYRLGEVGPNTSTGISNSKSFLNLLLGGCVRLGMFPTSSFSFDWTPVDSVANAMAYCVSHGSAAGEIFHVMQQRSIKFELVINCLIEEGIRLRDVSYSELWSRLEENVRSRDSSSELTLLRALLPRPSGSNDLTTILVDAQRFYSRYNFEQLLRRSTISFAELDEHTLSGLVTRAQSSMISKSAVA
jgi:amino acid adenylation domain-containing protein/thioester reductase-like protein